MPESSSSVLIVGFRPADARFVSALLAHEPCSVAIAVDDSEALRLALHDDFAVIVLDVGGGALERLETVRMLGQRDGSLGATPVIVTGANSTEETATAAYHAGAVDYLLRPLDPDAFRAKVRVFLRFDQTRRRLRDELNERRHLTDTLRELSALQQGILNSTHLAICSTDVDGLLRTWNAGAEQLFGWAMHDVVGQTCGAALFRADDPAAAWRELATEAEARHAVDAERVCVRRDGSSFPARVAISALRSAEGVETGFLLVVFDISVRKQAEEALVRAVRLKDEFLANMSHELRTPLTAILGASEATLEELEGMLPPRQVKALTTISTSGHHLLSLINDILDLAKIGAGMMELHAESLRLDEFCRSCLVFVTPQARQKRVDLAFESDGDDKHFWADSRRFKQVLVNLLTNAVKFTPEGGRVGLSVASPEGEEVVRFTVWDTGIGIAPEDQATLFRAFTQIDSGLNRAQEGTGLGLALVAQIMELHGGSVTLDSAPGAGTRVTVALPQPAASSPPEPDTTALPLGDTTAHPAPSAIPRGTRILLAEDNEANIETIGGYLEDKGCLMQYARNGAEALALARDAHPSLIIMDIQMPVMDGLSAIRAIRDDQTLKDIPIIALTALAMPGDRDRCLAAGATEYASKPMSLRALAALASRLVVS